MWSDDVIRHIHMRVMNHIANVAQDEQSRAAKFGAAKFGAAKFSEERRT